MALILKNNMKGRSKMWIVILQTEAYLCRAETHRIYLTDAQDIMVINNIPHPGQEWLPLWTAEVLCLVPSEWASVISLGILTRQKLIPRGFGTDC